MLEFAKSLRCAMNFSVLSCGGGQGQIPQSPLLDKILWLLRNDRRVHQVSGRMVGSHVDVGDGDGDVVGTKVETNLTVAREMHSTVCMQ